VHGEAGDQRDHDDPVLAAAADVVQGDSLDTDARTRRISWDSAPAINSPTPPTTTPTLEPRAIGSPRASAGTVHRSSRAFAPMINTLGPVADAEAVDQRGRL